jgi:hypothetical protein
VGAIKLREIVGIKGEVFRNNEHEALIIGSVAPGSWDQEREELALTNPARFSRASFFLQGLWRSARSVRVVATFRVTGAIVDELPMERQATSLLPA